MRQYLNGFIVTGAILTVIGLAGLAFGNRLLTEPGQTPDSFAWAWYLFAAAIMVVNGIASIRTAARVPAEAPAAGRKTPQETAKADER